MTLAEKCARIRELTQLAETATDFRQVEQYMKEIYGLTTEYVFRFRTK